MGWDEQKQEFARREALQNQILASIDAFSGGDRLGRDEAHDRRAPCHGSSGIRDTMKS